MVRVDAVILKRSIDAVQRHQPDRGFKKLLIAAVRHFASSHLKGTVTNFALSGNLMCREIVRHVRKNGVGQLAVHQPRIRILALSIAAGHAMSS